MTSYKTLLVHLDPRCANQAVLAVATDLALLFSARVIGVAGGHTLQPGLAAGDILSADLVERDHQESVQQLHDTKERLETALLGRASGLEWCTIGALTPLAEQIATMARGCDIVVTGSGKLGSSWDWSSPEMISDLVMRVGRPVLVVPSDATGLRTGHAILAWKDSREVRRAAADSLPLLARMLRVTVIEIAGDEELAAARDRVTDVAHWLGRHGITAEILVMPAQGDDAVRLDGVLAQQAADLLVAGAYGHSRLREWVLGGVTADLLLRPRALSLVSH
jgi:nucleotide-binding universal stress UspA family protein